MIRKIFYRFSWLVFIYHWLWSFFAALFCDFPSRNIFVLGVTGTKGKSTVLELTAFILEKAGKKVAVSSSLRNGESSMTMPGRFFLQRFLKKAVVGKCDYALIEVTSQGVSQSRHRFIKWDAVIFTNLSPEHIEAHGSFDNYKKAKLDFFRYAGSGFSKLFIINKDDASSKDFIDAVGGGKIILYEKSDLFSNLIGDFNKYNIGAAVAFAESRGIAGDIIKEAVGEFSGISGRMEFLKKEPFAVVLDYAHTPDSLRKVYEALREKNPNSHPPVG
ncbi:MAG: Mur ligase family protein, partial [Patescibacteria group bacterium]